MTYRSIVKGKIPEESRAVFVRHDYVRRRACIEFVFEGQTVAELTMPFEFYDRFLCRAEPEIGELLLWFADNITHTVKVSKDHHPGPLPKGEGD